MGLAKQLQPHADLILRLCTIPGVDFTTAAVIVAEIGFDMSRFPDAAHLASWAGLCPGHNESAGKRYSGSTRKGNRYLRRVLTQSAWSLKRKKNCFLTALFWRISTRGVTTRAGSARHNPSTHDLVDNLAKIWTTQTAKAEIA